MNMSNLKVWVLSDAGNLQGAYTYFPQLSQSAPLVCEYRLWNESSQAYKKIIFPP